MTNNKTDQVSSSYKRSYGYVGHDLNMFLEDFHQNIVSSYSAKDNVNCFLEPENKFFEDFICELFYSRSGYYEKSLNSTVIEAIDYIASNIVYFGSSIFELVKSENVNGTIVYKLIPVHFDKIKIKRKTIEQIYIYGNGVKKNIIPKDKCFIIEFPESLGGKNNYLKFLDSFSEIDNKSPMLTIFNDSLMNSKYYNISLHQNRHNLELWKKSKVFYWPHRGGLLNGGMFSEFYINYRQLQFLRAKIILRDHIIENLKIIIKSLSVIMNIDTALRIEGLMTITDIEEKIKHWKEGNLSYKEVRSVLF